MSRTWPGNTSVDYLTIPASSVFAFNTNICMMAIVNVPTLRNTPNLEFIAVVGSNTTPRGWFLAFGDDDGQLDFNQPVGSDVFGGAGTAILTGEWLAVGVFGSTGTVKDFKRYRYGTSTLATFTSGTTNTMVVPDATDPGFIGQYIVKTNNNSIIGQIDRVLLGQGTVSDAEFTAWARAGTVPPNIVSVGQYACWILSPSGVATNPEVDTGPHGLNITTITGTTASAAFVLPDSGPFINVNDPIAVGDRRFIPV